MKRLAILLSSIGLLSFMSLAMVGAPKVLAVDVLSEACNNPNATERPTVCEDNRPSGPNPLFGPDGVATQGIQIFALITGVTAVIVIIVSGIRFMTTMGDPNSVATARRAVIYAIVGLVIAAFAQLIVSFVLTRL